MGYLYVWEAKLDTHNQIWLVKVESLTNVFMVKIDKWSGKILEISRVKEVTMSTTLSLVLII